MAPQIKRIWLPTDEEMLKAGFEWVTWIKGPPHLPAYSKTMPFTNCNRCLVLDHDVFIPMENVSSFERLRKTKIE